MKTILLSILLAFALTDFAHGAAFDFNGDLRWTGGVVPYAWDATTDLVHFEPTDEHKKQAERVMRGWQKAADINFVKRTNQADLVYISETRLPGVNFSWVAKSGGAQPMWIDNWEDRLILHEMGHSLGLTHEHQRSDRDAYVDCWWWHAWAGTQINFTKEASVKHTAYDYLSLMHYDESAYVAPWVTTTYTLHPKDEAYIGRIGRETWFGKDGTQERYLNPVYVGDPEEYRAVGTYGYLSPLDRVGIQSEYGLPNGIKLNTTVVTGGSLPGVKYRLSGGAAVKDTIARMVLTRENPVTSGAAWTAEFVGLPHGTYTVTPTLAGYVFSPSSATRTLDGGVTPSQEFEATVDDNTPQMWN